jgi:large subunit ribosomal protein L1
MARSSKAQKKQHDAVEKDKVYGADEAFALIKDMASAKFTESIDVAINLGVDPKKSDQVVRGSTVLPHGTGKTVRVAVFAQGENAEAAKAAGADVVGMEDLAERIQGGELNFDVVIASPDAMRVVGKLGQILGPRGLMPNPKVGTVSPDVAGAVQNAKAGQVRYRTDRAGTIHCSIGNVGFEPGALRENLAALLTDLDKSKPASSKGVYMKKVSVSSTMGPGLQIDRATVAAAGGEAAA